MRHIKGKICLIFNADNREREDEDKIIINLILSRKQDLKNLILNWPGALRFFCLIGVRVIFYSIQAGLGKNCANEVVVRAGCIIHVSASAVGSTVGRT